MMNSADDVIDVQVVRRPTSGAGTSDAASAAGRADQSSLATWGWVSYILHLVVAIAAVAPGAQVSIVLLVIALIIDLVKKGDATGTWQASHFGWRIRSVLWAGALYLVSALLLLLIFVLITPAPFGVLLWVLFFAAFSWIPWVPISIWFLYRIVRGMARMNAGRPVGGV